MMQRYSVGRLTLVLAAMVVILGTAGTLTPAAGQLDSREGIALQNQILELRRQVEQLRAQGGGQGGYVPAPEPARPQLPLSSDFSAQLLDRVARLEEQVRTLRGRNDELTNQMRQMNADLNKQIADLGFQLQSGGTAGRPAATPPASASLGSPPLPSGNLAAGAPAPVTPPRRTPEMALQEGNAALARRDYPGAEAAAKEVLAGRSPRAIDAQFLYAQALAGERNYPAAAVAYNDTYEHSHTGTHAADSLLGLATTLAALNDNAAACGALNKLQAQFPTPRGDLIPPINSLRIRTQCR